MKKQEVINELMSRSREITFGDDENVYLNRERTIDLVAQINEIEEVVIPRYVAEWVEQAKKSGLYITFHFQNAPESVDGWLHEIGNPEKLMKAWLFGYKIEEDKRYLVRIPRLEADVLKFNKKTNRWFFGNEESSDDIRETHTKEQLYSSNLGWVFEKKFVEEVEK